LLGIGQRTLWRLTQAGAIPAVRIGRSVRYHRPDLEAWVERSKRRSVSLPHAC
jgi:excisionase family DNA binding protein